jgi:tape measure domain-containing protein
VAEQIGAAVFDLILNNKQFNAGLNASIAASRRAGAAISQGLNSAGGAATRLGGATSELVTGFNALSAAGAAAGLAFGVVVKQIADAGIAAESAAVRLEALTGRFGESGAAQAIVAKASADLNLSLTEASNGFAQLYGALRPSGTSLEDIQTVFVGLTATAKNFGLQGAAVSGVLTQLQQGLASGRFQGDELRSVLEQLPPLSQALAKELGVSVGQLKDLGSQGKISSQDVINAFKQLEQVELGGLAKTLGTSAERLTALKNETEKAQVEISKLFGPTVLEGVSQLAGGIGNVVELLKAGKKAADEFQRSLPKGAQDVADNVNGFNDPRLFSAPAAIAQNIGGAFGVDLLNEVDFLWGKIVGSAKAYNAEAAKPSDPAAAAKALAEERGRQIKQLESARAAANEKILRPALANLAALERTIGLEGSALRIARAQIEVEKKRTAEIQARQNLSDAVQSNKPVADQENLLASATAAGIALRVAQIEAGQALKDAAKESADIIKTLPKELQSQIERSATDGLSVAAAAAGAEYSKLIDQANKPTVLSEDNLLKLGQAYDAYDQKLAENQRAVENAGLGVGKFSAAALTAVQNLSNAVKAADSARLGNRTAVEGAFKFLSDANQSNIIDLALRDINNKSFGLGIDLSKVDVSTPESIFEALNAVRSLEGANKALEDALANQTTATQELAAKDWQVQVNVDAGGGTSEVILQ